MLFIASTNYASSLKPAIRSRFNRVFSFDVPEAPARTEIINMHAFEWVRTTAPVVSPKLEATQGGLSKYLAAHERAQDCRAKYAS